MGGSTKLMSSGAGGVILTTPGSIAADVTVNLPTQNSTLAINGPAFSAYQSSAQTLSSNTWTKIQFQTEEFDTNSNFDNATNYRFTPTVAGYYQVSGCVTIAASTTAVYSKIYKNGSSFKFFNFVAANANNSQGSCLVYLNGTTDYIELYGYIIIGQALNNAIDATYFQAALVRAA